MAGRSTESLDVIRARSMYRIEDERHAEPIAEYGTLSEAIAELERLSSVPWDADPNRAPCQNWRNCGRVYELIEYDASALPWKEVRRVPGLEISRKGVQWLGDLREKGRE